VRSQTLLAQLSFGDLVNGTRRVRGEKSQPGARVISKELMSYEAKNGAMPLASI
jgi:hypothetical protein